MVGLIHTHPGKVCVALGSLMALTAFGASRIPIPSVRTAMLGLGMYSVFSGTILAAHFPLSSLSSKKVIWLANGALFATSLSLFVGDRIPKSPSDGDAIWAAVQFFGAQVLSIAVGFSDTLWERCQASRSQINQMPAQVLLADILAAQIELAVVRNVQ